MTETLVLDRRQMRGLLDLPSLIPVVRAALTEAGGDGSDGAATALGWREGSLHVKAGWLRSSGLATVKANVRPHAGGAAGAILVLDTEGPGVRAVLDSADLTALRTAAIAAVAADALAPSGRELTVAVLGLGPVGRHSLAAVAAVRPVSRARVWSRSVEHRRQPVGSALPVEVADDPCAAVAGADLVITATPAREPFLDPRWLAPGAVVLAMGADTVGKREVGGGLAPTAALLADDPAGALAVGECAWIDDAGRRLVALGDLLRGGAAIAGDRPLTVFDSVGTAETDVAAVTAVLDAATRAGVGTTVVLDAP